MPQQIFFSKVIIIMTDFGTDYLALSSTEHKKLPAYTWTYKTPPDEEEQSPKSKL